MSRIEEIEQAIEKLPPEEFLRIARWIREREQRQWDERLDRDSASGKLDFLFEEAESEPKLAACGDCPEMRSTRRW